MKVHMQIYVINVTSISIMIYTSLLVSIFALSKAITCPTEIFQCFSNT